MKGITLWGSIASIVGLAIALITFYSPAQSQADNQATTYGNQSPAINDMKGDIIYNNASPVGSKMTKPAAVMREPSLDVLDENKRVCIVEAGTSITLLNEKANLQNADIWRKLKVESGDCAGNVGWVMINTFSR